MVAAWHGGSVGVRNGKGSSRASQNGAVAIMFAASLIVIMGVFGLALDLSRLFNRKAELQSVANAAAMAAARELNGTAAGLTAAAAKAKAAAEGLKYQYDLSSVQWSDAALRFGETPAGTSWVALDDAKPNPRRWRYARVDSERLNAQYGTIDMFFIQVVARQWRQGRVAARATAGRAALNVTPLAICAMSATAAESRTWDGPPIVNELVEYGFRRGVSYDLMKLNPGGTDAENFVVDPFATPGDPAAGIASNTAAGVVGPFICTGRVALTQLVDAKIAVTRPFPIATFYKQLNSRFDQFHDKASGAYCSPDVAPPDVNIKAYPFTGITWMAAAPAGQSAASTTSGGKLRTVADLVPPASAANTAPAYGPLWSYARAVPYAAYQPGMAEPAGGYAGFGATSWASLYKPGQPEPKNYPATGTPYAASGGETFLAPSDLRNGIRHRRVLNVPLLACPVPASTPASATVLAIGKFFMTVPATDSQLHAEFGGIVGEAAIAGDVELYP